MGLNGLKLYLRPHSAMFLIAALFSTAPSTIHALRSLHGKAYLQPLCVIDVTPNGPLNDVVPEKLKVTASGATPFVGA